MKTAADEMFDLLNTRFFFRAPSAQMAQISSKDLGEQEVDISKENVSYGANTLRDGVSLGHQTVTRPVVSPSEIQALDDLLCYLRTPGVDLITKLDLEFDVMKDIWPSFNKRSVTLSQPMQEAYAQAPTTKASHRAFTYLKKSNDLTGNRSLQTKCIRYFYVTEFV